MDFNKPMSPHTFSLPGKFPGLEITYLEQLRFICLALSAAQNADQANNLCQLFRREEGIL